MYNKYSRLTEIHRQQALAEDLMANSTASISIKLTVAFNRDDTFVSGPGCALLTAADPSNAASP
jgi:hypothetical protein